MAEEAHKEFLVKDPVVTCIGNFGRWQLLMTFLLSLVQLPSTFHIYSMTFIAAEPNVTCTISQGSKITQEQFSILNIVNGTIDKCSLRDLNYNLSFRELRKIQSNSTKPCSKWRYDTDHFGSSIVSEWDLVCDRSKLRQVAEMMFLFGIPIGGIIGGFLSDRFGRKKTLMFSILAQIVIGLVISITPWLSLFIALRGLLGFMCVTANYTALVLCLELVGGKWLTISGVSYLFPISISYILISGMAYTIKNWRLLQVAVTSSAIVLLPAQWWFLPESPRWLLTMCQKEKTLEVLKQAAEFNGMKLPGDVDKILQQSMIKAGEQPPKVNLLDLYRTRYLRRISLVMYVVWFTIIFVYFGLVLNLSYLGGDIYISSIISGAVEFPAVAFSIIILLRLGRRWPMSLTAICSGIACFLAAYTKKGDWSHLTLAMAGRLLISSSHVIMPVYTAELFPTAIRNLGIGASNIAAGFALVTVPYIWNLAGVVESLPLIVLGICGLVGGLAVLLLPETTGLRI